MKKKKIIIDTDIGDEIDDALALYFAMKQGMDIVGVTTVFKNTDERARIAKRLLSLYGNGYEKVPIFAGHGTPIAEEKCDYPHSCHFHGELESNEYAPDGDSEAAVDFLIESCKKFGEELVIVAIGPFTNIAKAIEKDAEAMNMSGKVVIMGGAYYRQYADWNVMCDVEAADIMFKGLNNLECIGADITHRLLLSQSEHQTLIDCKNDAAVIEIAELIRLWSVVNPDRCPTLHDPLAVYYAVYPEICEVEKQRIAVIVDGLARGLTLNIDAYNKAFMNPVYRNVSKECRATVARDIDAIGFINLFIKAFS